MSYLAWDLPSFTAAKHSTTSTQDAILDACYASGLAAECDDTSVSAEDEAKDDDDSDNSGIFVPSDPIDETRCSLGIQGCGRTDTGVSGTRQVVSVRLKTAEYEDESDAEDFSYVEALNHFLPPEIRILSWSVVPEEFNARFCCTLRSYTYRFPKGRGFHEARLGRPTVRMTY